MKYNKKIIIKINSDDGNSITLPIQKLSHTIIFGSTGSGKSNLLHMIITDLVKNYSPNELKLALIDPKYVEFNSYKSLPNLFGSIAKSTEEINTLLNDCLSQVGTLNKPIIILIDELAELTLNNDTISKITSILNNDTNSNVYLIMASQRPNLIPSEIINKINTKICFPIDFDKLPKELSNEIKKTQKKNIGEMIFINSDTHKHIQTKHITQSIINDSVNNCKK